jgi:outer membrane lipoprotein SlyB
MLIRRDKQGRSPWIAAGAVVGALVGFMTVSPIRGIGDELGMVRPLLGAVAGVVVGIVLDRYKNRR